MPQGATASEKSGATSASNSIEVPWRFFLSRGINDHSARTTDISIVFRFLPSKKLRCPSRSCLMGGGPPDHFLAIPIANKSEFHGGRCHVQSPTGAPLSRL